MSRYILTEADARRVAAQAGRQSCRLECAVCERIHVAPRLQDALRAGWHLDPTLCPECKGAR